MSIISACNPTKYLADDEYLHVKNNVKVEQDESEYVESVNKNEVKSFIRPKENSKFLGTRFPQWLYYKSVSDGDTSAFERVMLKSFAKQPSLLDTSLVISSEEKIKNYLFNHGYFNSEVNSTIEVKDKKSTATYTLYPKYQHVYDSANYVYSDSIINLDEIASMANVEDYIKRGENYDIDDFQSLRTELVNKATQNGFYKFNRSAVYVVPDTLASNGKVNIEVFIDNPKDSLYNKKFYFRNIYTQFGRGTQDKYSEPKTFDEKLFSFGRYSKVKPKVLNRFILMEKDSLYRKEKHLNTINKFVNLPIVGYANVEFQEVEENDTLYLDAFITANTRPRLSLTFEPTVSEFQGPAVGADLGFQHRNLFHGAEHFEFTIGGGFESAQTQNEQTKIFGTSYIEGEPKITFPRLLGLDKIVNNIYNKTYDQTTTLGGRFGWQDRRGLYQIIETSLQQSWDWKSSPHNRHTFSVIDWTFFQSQNISDYYQSILDKYPSNRYSLEDRVILSTKYNYAYSNRLKRPNKDFFTLNTSAESTGNLVYTLFGSNRDTLKIANNPVARFVRGDVDFAYNFKVTPTSNFITRLYGGVAYPIGEIQSIPAVKQFYSGGSNSMRAWRARSLGPGDFDYRGDDDYRGDALVDQRGDIKLEANAEYRFPLTKLFGQNLEGALFTDAGNIWTFYEPDEDEGGRPGAVFTKNFYDQIAIGSGGGFRLKIQNFFTIRTDVAFKIHDPSLPVDERWVKGPFESNNMNITLGIGYPFFDY